MFGGGGRQTDREIRDLDFPKQTLLVCDVINSKMIQEGERVLVVVVVVEILGGRESTESREHTQEREREEPTREESSPKKISGCQEERRVRKER